MKAFMTKTKRLLGYNFKLLLPLTLLLLFLYFRLILSGFLLPFPPWCVCNTTVSDGSQGYSGLSPKHYMKCVARHAVKLARERTIEKTIHTVEVIIKCWFCHREFVSVLQTFSKDCERLEEKATRSLFCKTVRPFLVKMSLRRALLV